MGRRKNDIRNQKIGMQLRKLRKRQKLSMSAVARQLNVTYQQIQKFESGKNQISLVSLCELAPIFQMSATDLFQYVMQIDASKAVMMENELDKIPDNIRHILLQMIEAIKRALNLAAAQAHAGHHLILHFKGAPNGPGQEGGNGQNSCPI